MFYGGGFKMELRKFESNEHYVIISALVGLMDSITDYSKVSFEKFKELLSKNESIWYQATIREFFSQPFHKSF